MVSALLVKCLVVALAAQVVLSIINSLFVLSGDAVVVLIGFHGLIHRTPSVLLFFVVVQVLSVAMDIVRLTLWSPYILQNVMLVPATLGVYFLVLTVFQAVVKLVVAIFTIIVRREINDWLADPSLSSTLTRQNMTFLPEFLAPPQHEALLQASTTPVKRRVGVGAAAGGTFGRGGVGSSAGGGLRERDVASLASGVAAGGGSGDGGGSAVGTGAGATTGTAFAVGIPRSFEGYQSFA